MRIGSSPAPTPIVSGGAASRDQMQTSHRSPEAGTAEAAVEAEPLVIALGSARIELHPGELARVVEQMNETARIFSHALQFQVSEDRVVVRVIDTESGSIVREIPPEKLLEAFGRLEKLVGLLLDQRI